MKIEIPSFKLKLSLSYVIPPIATFMLGILIAQNSDSKLLAILIGALASIFAFLGIVYSKNRERDAAEDERRIEKIEGFFVKLIETMEDLESESKVVFKAQYEKIRGHIKNREDIDLLFEDANKQRLKVYISRSQLSMYRGLYAVYLGSLEDVDSIIRHQDKVARIILDMTDCMEIGSLEAMLREASSLIGENRKLVLALSRKIKLR